MMFDQVSLRCPHSVLEYRHANTCQQAERCGIGHARKGAECIEHWHDDRNCATIDRPTFNRQRTDHMTTIIKTQGAYARPGILTMKLIVVAALMIGLFNCKGDGLIQETASLEIVAEPGPGQIALSAPVGVDLGAAVSINGEAQAVFALKVRGRGVIDIKAMRIEDVVAGKARAQLFIEKAQVNQFPITMEPGQSGALVVDLTPAADKTLATARVVLDTFNPGTKDRQPQARVQAMGVFLGEPNLEIAYGGKSYALPEDCDFIESGVCSLPVFDLGVIALNTRITDVMTLRNRPKGEDCRLPDLENGEADCNAVCLVTVNKNTEWKNIGLGVAPSDGRFSILAGDTYPFQIDPENARCSASTLPLSIVRGAQTVPVAFAAPAEVGESTAELFVETDDLNAPRVRIPLKARSAVAPVAQARLRACDVDNVPPSCTNADSIEPLMRVFFDGRESRDTLGGTDLADYRWKVVDAPRGAGFDVGAYLFEGQGNALLSMFVPIAGTYKMRLVVTDTLNGVRSVPNDSLDVVTFEAIPQSRLHLQLVWDNIQTDMDIHLVYLADGTSATDLVYHGTYDCKWRQCQPYCLNDKTCTPIRWFSEDEPFEGANPRMDIDDEEGYGPENINIDEPRDGLYHLYVHYYGIVTDIDSPTNVTVRVFGDGLLQGEYRRQLFFNELWAIAELEWVDGGLVLRQAASDIEGRIGSVVQLDSIPPRDEGFYFSPTPF